MRLRLWGVYDLEPERNKADKGDQGRPLKAPNYYIQSHTYLQAPFAFMGWMLVCGKTLKKLEDALDFFLFFPIWYLEFELRRFLKVPDCSTRVFIRGPWQLE